MGHLRDTEPQNLTTVPPAFLYSETVHCPAGTPQTDSILPLAVPLVSRAHEQKS